MENLQFRSEEAQSNKSKTFKSVKNLDHIKWRIVLNNIWNTQTHEKPEEEKMMFSSSMLPANTPQIKERTLTTPGHVVPTFGNLLNSSSSPKLANTNTWNGHVSVIKIHWCLEYLHFKSERWEGWCDFGYCFLWKFWRCSSDISMIILFSSLPFQK